MVDNISLPVIIPDRLLISPGIWNGDEYSAKEISEAFAKTDWGDKDKISLWLNHDDRNTSAFVGYVRKPILASRGRVFGDLELWDEKTATILTQAMAKFGISAKIKGEEDKKGKMRNFTFENFSVVTVPACSEAYINLAKEEKIVSKYLMSNELKELARGEGKGIGGPKQGDGGTDYCYCPKCNHREKHERDTPCNELKCPHCGATLTGVKPEELSELAEVTGMETERKRRGMSPSVFYAAPRDPPSSSALPIFDKAHVQNAMARFNQTNFKNSAEKATAKRKIISAANKFGIKVSDEFKSLSDRSERRLKMGEKEKEKEEKEEVVEDKVEESTAEDAEENKELSEKDMLKELSIKFDKLISLLSKKLEDEELEDEEPESKEKEVPLEESEEENKEEENKELIEVKKELSEIKKKLDSPKSKTIRNLSSNNIGSEVSYSNEKFANLLSEIDSPMKFT